MSKSKTVTIPVEFTIKELLELWGAEFIDRKKFRKIAQSAEFRKEMSKLLYEDFIAMGGFDDLDLFEDAITDECFD